MMNEHLQEWYRNNEDRVRALAHDIWNHPESSMHEAYACQQVAQFMSQEGFTVKTAPVLPGENAVVNTVYATYGSGKPVIGILGEYDALEALGQEAVPYQSAIDSPGHGCGHNLICACSVAAASALKAAMEAEQLQGTLVYIAAPSEENLSGKVYLASQGYFDDLDVCLCWHPGGMTTCFDNIVMTATTNIVFEFQGKTAHAGGAPWDGRSALDAAELMSVGVNYLREHMTPDCRVHYIYQDAGAAPNIVPEHASVYYFIRSRDENNGDLVQRVKNIAEGAALMTGTTMKYNTLTHCSGTVTSMALNQFCYQSALKVPALEYTEEEYAFARELYCNVTGAEQPLADEKLLPVNLHSPMENELFVGGSSDVGDVSHITPTIQVCGCGMVNKLPTHHWCTTATTGTSIGEKGAVYASKQLAQCGYDIFQTPEVIADFRQSWQQFKEEKNMPAYEKFPLPELK